MAYDTSWTYGNYSAALSYRNARSADIWTPVKVQWSGSQFVLVGYSSSPSFTANLMTSPDGITWTAVSAFTTAWGTTAIPPTVMCANGNVIIVGGYMKCMKSLDGGATWSTCAGLWINNTPTDIVWTGVRYLLAQKEATVNPTTNLLGYSTDGATWLFATSYGTAVQSSNSAGYGSQLSVGSTYIVANVLGTATNSFVYSSNGGLNWSYSTLNYNGSSVLLTTADVIATGTTTLITSTLSLSPYTTVFLVASNGLGFVSKPIPTLSSTAFASGTSVGITIPVSGGNLLCISPRATVSLSTDGAQTWSTLTMLGDNVAGGCRCVCYSPTLGRTLMVGATAISYSDAY